MANGWTPERRARQAEAIQRWQPWRQSTGPKPAEGKARVARNAYRGGRREELRVLGRVLRKLREIDEGADPFEVFAEMERLINRAWASQ